MTSTATEATPARAGMAGPDEPDEPAIGDLRGADPTTGTTEHSASTKDTAEGVTPLFGTGRISAPRSYAAETGPSVGPETKRRKFEPRAAAAAARAERTGRADRDKQGADPYIHGSEETVLLDLRDLREAEIAERAARDQAATTELESYRGSHRRAAARLQQEDASLLYADGGTAIPLERVREVCHDLRQPVAAIMMLASAAEMRPDVPESVRLALQEITDQAEDISTAVRQFLDDAKRGVDGLGDPRPVNVAELARESVERWRPTFQGRIDCAAADDPLHVTIDPVLFRRALGNVLSNATRAADVCGHVAVTVRMFQTERGARAVIEVDDSGPGFGNIPSGHGLGLAVVRRTVEAAGGSVEFAEGTLGGALVRMVLPVTAKQQLSLEDELAASFQGEIPLSALADIVGGEEFADGHVLATRISALPEQAQLPAAPLAVPAVATAANDATDATAEIDATAPDEQAEAPFDSYATPLWAARVPAEVPAAPAAAPFDAFAATAPARLPAPSAADRLPDEVASRALAAVPVPVPVPMPSAETAEPATSPTAAQHANALLLPSRTALTLPPRIPVPAGVPQVAQLSLLPGGAF